MPTPTNPDLYEKVKKEVYRDIPKHSLFRSAQVVKRYKNAGGQYSGKKTNGITNWFKANWISVNDMYHDNKTVPCGSSNAKKKYDEYPLCRPKDIVDKMSKPQMKKLIDAKNKTKDKPIKTSKVLDTDKLNVTSKYT